MTFVCFEANFTKAPSNTWWIDYGSNVHVANSIQGFLTTISGLYQLTLDIFFNRIP